MLVARMVGCAAGTTHFYRDLEDPAGMPVSVVRPVIGEIDRRMRDLLAERTDDPVPDTRASG